MVRKKDKVKDERPIIFSMETVQAIMEGRKNQTRRICKNQEDPKPEECPYGVVGNKLWVREAWRKDGSKKTIYKSDGDKKKDVTWKPSIHMKRGDSRLMLEITSIKTEKVQSISLKDAKADGFKSVEAFKEYWGKLHTERGKAWEDNPLVWAVGFKVL